MRCPADLKKIGWNEQRMYPRELLQTLVLHWASSEHAFGRANAASETDREKRENWVK